MLKSLFSPYRVAFTFCVLWLVGCSDSDSSPTPNDTTFNSSFESGNIGEVEQVGDNSWNIYLRDDNNDASLPDNFRNWWYLRISDYPAGEALQLRLKNRGWNYYYVPVYSYDQQTWFRFDESAITQDASSDVCDSPVGQSPPVDSCDLNISVSGSLLDGEPIYLARYYPYTYSNLVGFLAGIEGHECLEQSSLGLSPVFNEALPYLMIRCPDGNDTQIVWMHARTHSAETGGSYLLEGAITQLLEDMQTNQNNARDVVYFITPMHNVDGVITGNYRTNPASINLENQWLFDDSSLPYLSADAPIENQLVNEPMRTVSDSFSGQPLIALNLHSSNSPPDQAAFAFPHFGDDPDLYTEEEISLWNNSIRLLELLSNNYDGRVDTNASGGSGFLNSFFPETWWWNIRAANAVAMTIETTYGRAGFPHWATQDDIRQLGRSLTQSIYDYRDGVVPPVNLIQQRLSTEPLFMPDEVESKQ